jgi:hypothetical protein
VLTFVLLVHGNPGGWQFSYRYAIILLPWMFRLLVGNGPVKTSAIEVSLFIVSVAINAMATYQFLWTTEIHAQLPGTVVSVSRRVRIHPRTLFVRSESALCREKLKE